MAATAPFVSDNSYTRPTYVASGVDQNVDSKRRNDCIGRRRAERLRIPDRAVRTDAGDRTGLMTCTGVVTRSWMFGPGTSRCGTSCSTYGEAKHVKYLGVDDTGPVGTIGTFHYVPW